MDEVGSLKIRRQVGERVVLRDEDGEIARVLVERSGENGGAVTLVIEAPQWVKISRDPS